MAYINIRSAETVDGDMIMLGVDDTTQVYVVTKYVGGHMLDDRYDTTDLEFANNYFESLLTSQ
jgi:hypothetical protein